MKKTLVASLLALTICIVPLAAASDGEIEIVVHPKMFEFKPPLPNFEQGEVLGVTVDWSLNNGNWASVTLTNFKDSSGNLVDADPPNLQITDGDGSRHTIWITGEWADDELIKYDIVYERVSPSESFTVDPVVLVKKPGFRY